MIFLSNKREFIQGLSFIIY